MILSPHEIAYLARQGWASSTDQQIAVAVALAESAGETNALARSKTGDNLGQRDHGLWQISGRWHGEKLQKTPAWRDPWVNLSLAVQVHAEGGWKLWSTFTSESYLAFMPDADHGLRAPFPPPGGVPARMLAKMRTRDLP